MRLETRDLRSGRRFRNIKAWQRADGLVAKVYEVTRTFPKEEQYGLVSQMRRAAVSVAANIVEGAARRSAQEYMQFLSVARASLRELSYYIHLATRLGYLSEKPSEQLDAMAEETARTLYGLICSVAEEPGKVESQVSSLMSQV